MSGTLQIHFDSDMPPASVEVVSPSLETVGRIWLGPGQTRRIDVPSEGSFLRVHLASGEVVTLQDPGSLNRTIGRDAIQRAIGKTRRTVKSAAAFESLEPLSSALEVEALVNGRVLEGRATPILEAPEAQEAHLEGELTVRLGDVPITMRRPGREAVCTPAVPELRETPYDLTIASPGATLLVRLPGSTAEVLVRSDFLTEGRRVVSIRVTTIDAVADTIGSYLARGDLRSASAMAEWTDQAEQLLFGKVRNPFGAIVGAYLLLRLRRFDRMRDWTRNLADWWPKLADGSVIRAWQLILMRRKDEEAQIRKYLESAATAPLPVFSEGLRLLRDGLRLLHGDSDDPAKGGVVIWNSPFTAVVESAAGSSASRIDFDIDYAPRM